MYLELDLGLEEELEGFSKVIMYWVYGLELTTDIQDDLTCGLAVLLGRLYLETE